MESWMVWKRPSSPVKGSETAKQRGDVASPEPSCSPGMHMVRAKSPKPSEERSTSSEGRSTPTKERSTLSDGDVVVFRKGGGLYGVSQPTGDFPDAPGFFRLVPLQESEDSTDPSAQLLVIRQGNWIGFKSAAAGGRFLQARRRGPDHLCFYNTNWGTWEQWELVGDEPTEGWTRWTFQFRSRRLENFVFAVEVERLDSTSASASLAHGQVQRLVKAVQENVDEKQGNVLHAMSNLLTSEWKHFMQREMQARKALQKELSGMRQELLDVRESALSYIGKLNADTEATVTFLMDHIAAKEEEVRQLDESVAATCTERLAHQERLADTLARRKERSLLQEAFKGWLERCLRKRELARLETHCRERRRLRVLRKVLGAWEQAWRRRKSLRTAEAEVEKRVKSLTMARATRFWQQWAEERRTVKKTVNEQRRRSESRIMRRVMSQWWGVLSHKEVVSAQLLDTWQTSVARQAFASWCEFVALKQRKRLIEKQVRTRSQVCLLKASFRAWLERVALRKKGRERLVRLSRALEKRRLVALFSIWKEQAEYGVNRVQEAERLFEKRQIASKRAVFVAWRGTVQDCCSREALAERMRQKLEARLLSRGFQAWVLYLEQQRQSELAASRLERTARQRLVRRRFESWRNGVVASKERQKVAEFVARKADRGMLVDSLEAWQTFVRRAKEARDLKAGLSRRWAARCAVLAFDSWMDYVAERKWKRERLRKAQTLSDRKLLARTVSAWLDRSQHRRTRRETVVAARRAVDRGSLRRSFLGWRDVMEESKDTKEEEAFEAERRLQFAARWAQRRALEEGFGVWKAFVAAAQATRLEESHHAIEELLKEERAKAWAKRQLLAAAFSAWRDGVWEGLKERRAAEEREKERRRQEEAKEALAERWGLRRRMERAFRLWREEREGARIDCLAAEITMVEEQQERERLEVERMNFADRWAKKRLKEKGFSAWQEALDETVKSTKEEKGKEEQERKLELRAKKWAMRRRIERAWKVWRSEVAETREEAVEEAQRKELEALNEVRADIWAKRRLVERAFSSWVDFVEKAEEAKRVDLEREKQREEDSRKESESAEKRAATWAARRLLENVFIGWREEVHVAKEERLMEEAAEARAEIWAKRRLLERAFFTWKMGVEGIVEKRMADQDEKERESAARLEAEQHLKRRALLAWEELAVSAKELRANEAVSCRELMQSVFQTWRHVTELRQRALFGIKKRRQLSCLRGAFSAWWNVVEESQTAVRVAQKLSQDKQQQVLMTAFFAWRTQASKLAAQRRQLSAARKIRNSRQLAAAVRSWRQLAAARQSRRLAEQRIEAKVRRRRLREAFSAWKNFAAQEVQTRGELGACITRKRMAKRWFMQWYWDAFDNEIHRSMVDIVGSTQRSFNEAERAAPAIRSNGHASLAVTSNGHASFAGSKSNGHASLSLQSNGHGSLASRSLTSRPFSPPKSDTQHSLASQSNGHVLGSFNQDLSGRERSSAEEWRALMSHGLGRPKTSPARVSSLDEGVRFEQQEGGHRRGQDKEGLSLETAVTRQKTGEADTWTAASPSFSKQVEAILGAPIRSGAQERPNIERIFGKSRELPPLSRLRGGT